MSRILLNWRNSFWWIDVLTCAYWSRGKQQERMVGQFTLSIDGKIWAKMKGKWAAKERRMPICGTIFLIVISPNCTFECTMTLLDFTWIENPYTTAINYYFYKMNSCWRRTFIGLLNPNKTIILSRHNVSPEFKVTWTKIYENLSPIALHFQLYHSAQNKSTVEMTNDNKSYLWLICVSTKKIKRNPKNQYVHNDIIGAQISQAAGLKIRLKSKSLVSADKRKWKIVSKKLDINSHELQKKNQFTKMSSAIKLVLVLALIVSTIALPCKVNKCVH